MKTGSYVDVPKDLLKQIEKLEGLFTVDTAKLKEITDHFVNELEKGEWMPTDRPDDANVRRSQRKGGEHREFPSVWLWTRTHLSSP